MKHHDFKLGCKTAAVTALLAGCALGPTLPPDHLYAQAASLVAYERNVHPANLDQVDLSTVPPIRVTGEAADQPDYLQSRVRDCGAAVGAQDVIREVGRICRLRGGEYRRQGPIGVCVKPADPDHPLLAVSATRLDAVCTLVVLTEPRSQPAGPGYQKMLVEQGFKTQAALALENAMRQATLEQLQNLQAQEKARKEARLERELPLMRQRGASVCQESNGITYFAYVDDFTDQRLKLIVSSAFYTGHPGIAPGGFKQEVIWSTPESWHLC